MPRVQVVVNDVRIQLAHEALPFGGVGASGFGRYRGEAGFRTFSNQKTVMRQRGEEAALARARPPFGQQSFEAAEARLAALKSERL